MMAFKTLYSMKRVIKVKKGRTMIKLNTTKGIEWPFLDFVLSKLGFSRR